MPGLGFDADEPTYAVAAQMLLGVGVDRVELLTHNPDEAVQLRAAAYTSIAVTRWGCTCRR